MVWQVFITLTSRDWYGLETLATRMLVQQLAGLWTKEHQSSAFLPLLEGNPPVIGGFPSQRASNVESVCMKWRLRVDAQLNRCQDQRNCCCNSILIGCCLTRDFQAILYWNLQLHFDVLLQDYRQYLQCASNGDTAILHYGIHLWLYKECVISLNVFQVQDYAVNGVTGLVKYAIKCLFFLYIFYVVLFLASEIYTK